jgi:hypothetical protein
VKTRPHTCETDDDRKKKLIKTYTMTIREWLDTPCPDSEISYIQDGDKKIAYIPIGITERTLDEKFDWDTVEQKFHIHKTSNYWFASGSVLLHVRANAEAQAEHNANVGYERMISGAATIRISSKDDNMHYESTVLSLAINNAATRLGRRFGRHLNDRMVTGETSFVEKEDAPVIDIKTDRLLKLIADAKTPEELARYKDNVANANEREISLAYMNRLKAITQL